MFCQYISIWLKNWHYQLFRDISFFIIVIVKFKVSIVDVIIDMVIDNKILNNYIT